MTERHAEGKTLVDAASDQIIDLILQKNLKPGDRLPNEYDLAKMLGIGRSSLREATRRLVSRNVLQVRQGSGTFVSDKNGVPEDPLGLTFIGSSKDPRLALDLLDIRLMLEPEICSMAARRATPAQIVQLQACCDEVSRLIRSGQDYSDADAALHRCLAECCGNRVLPNLVPVITTAIPVTIATTNDEHRLRTDQQHHQIVDAIARRDPDGAYYAMIVHLNTNRDSIARSLKNARLL